MHANIYNEGFNNVSITGATIPTVLKIYGKISLSSVNYLQERNGRIAVYADGLRGFNKTEIPDKTLSTFSEREIYCNSDYFEIRCYHPE